MSEMSIEELVKEAVEDIKEQFLNRGTRVSNELRTAAMQTLRGQGSGRVYRVPGTKQTYTASAPGEVPAVRTGAFRASWTPSTITEGQTVISRIDSRLKAGAYLLGDLLENGTPGGRMAPRPHLDKILEKAEEAAVKIYSEPY